MGRYTGNTCRLLSQLTLTSIFFVVEIVVGYVTNSLALVGDSYHMLSDVAALLVGFASVRISKWPRNVQRNTYGWARAEVLGALINSVFLLALCFTILIEALQRMAKDEHIHDPDLMLIVGGIGLAINLVGLFLFHGHGHSHGGHGHSHGHRGHKGHGHSHGHRGHESYGRSNNKSKSQTDKQSHALVDHVDTEELTSIQSNDVYKSKKRCLHASLPLLSTQELTHYLPQVSTDELTHSLPLVSAEQKGNENCNGTVSGPFFPDDVEFGDVLHSSTHMRGAGWEEEGSIEGGTLHSSAQLNMRGVFLHVLGDALGSVVVIISALFIKYRTEEWRYKIDPAMSIIMVVIIFTTTIPLLKTSATILLQNVPHHIQVKRIQEKLLAKVEGVLAVHEFHVWQLAGSRIIATIHIECRSLIDYMLIAGQVKTFFHNEGIHSVTIQPEFTRKDIDDKKLCLLDCPDTECYKCRCCNEIQLYRENHNHETYCKPKQPDVKTKRIKIDMVTLDAKSRPPSSPNHYVEDPTAGDRRKPKQNDDSVI